MSMKEEFTAIDMATAAADGFRAGQRAAQSVGVPDALREAVEYLDDNPFNEIGAGSILHRAMRDALSSAPTVKAEQVDCLYCQGHGEVTRTSGQTAESYAEHNEECPERKGTGLSPSLPAAGSAVETLDAVAWLCEASKEGVKTQRRIVETWSETKDFTDHYRGRGCKVVTTALVSKRKHVAIVAALSAQQSAPEFCCELSYKAAKQAAWGKLDLTQCKCDHNEYCEHCWPDDFREGGKWHGGFETKQSAPERVSVPVELVESAANNLQLHAEESSHPGQYALIAELRALLASHGRGEA